MNQPENPVHPENGSLYGVMDLEEGNVFSHFFRISEALMFMVDDNLCVARINKMALSVLGFTAEEICGRPFLERIDEESREEIRWDFSIPPMEIRQRDPLVFVAKDGKRIYTLTRITRGLAGGRIFSFVSAWNISKFRASQEKFGKAFHSSSVIMLMFELESGIIVETNESACAMTGYRPGEMIGKTLEDLDIYPDREERKRIKKMLVEQGAVKDFEIMVKNRNGLECHGLFSMDVLMLEGRLCVLAVGNDFTLRKKAEDALMMAYKEQGKQKAVIERKSRELEAAKKMIEESARLVEESSRHKSEFIASMSHELRTPLNSIILLSGLLSQNRDGNLSGKELEYASVISAAGHDLLALINDVLDLSKVEAGRMEVNLTRVSLEYLCRKMKGYFSEMAGIKGLEFGIYPETGITEYLLADVQKLEQILKNLMANAIKFTEKGSVNIYIHRPSPSTDLSMIGLEGLEPSRTLAFSVADTGIGIAPEHMNLIFECYRQAGKDIAETYGGTGLGLPVSRVLAQLLGGDILVESEVGKGSRFTLYIPDNVHENHEKANPSSGLPEPVAASVFEKRESRLNGKKILVVDDDMRTVYSLIQNLEELSVDVIVAWDGVRCMKKLEENHDTSLVLLDLAMPRMDGFQVLEKIRSDEGTKNLPVVIITADVMKGGEKACLAAGADGYMAKPIDFEALLDLMERVLG